MINPSNTGWIDKFFAEQNPLQLPVVVYPEVFYKKMRTTGFVYGHVVSFDTGKPIALKGLTSEEISKVALLNTLYNIFGLVTHESNPERFIAKAVAFYNKMSPEGFNLLKKVLPGSSVSVNLEKIIDDRVQTNENFVSKNFSHILTNALLFEDVLAFRKYLIYDEIPHNYLKKLEETIVSIVSLALNTKSKKTEYDDLLIKLFEASVRFTKFSKVDVQNMEALEFDYFDSDLEKYYLLDLAVLAMWNDEKIDATEALFLKQIAGLMQLSSHFVAESIAATEAFIQTYKTEIPYFNYSNPVKHFYDHATQAVITLITRNKNRLIKELSNNGELMLLLTHSTHRHLEDKEKKKIKKQLLEICKTIPSLTIFLLPGGSLLLPILIKFIPKMLPTAFNENLEDN
ncbi:MAG: LETM1-related biofilm-associated protein [Flavobacterium sp.]|nr:LETM1-related biofilm-associated protein [Flavobacterium sp.]